MTTLMSVAVALAAGLLMTRIFKLLNLRFPDVTAYLIAGIAVGPYGLGALGIDGLGFISAGKVASLGVITDVALGFIAFAIGNEFRLSQLRETGKQAAVIGVFQGITAAAAVDICLIAFHMIWPDKLSAAAAITLGAVATATAPAATLMVVRQYKARGRLTDILLPVVALDDAVGLVVFAVSFGMAKAMTFGSVSAVSMIAEPLIEIAASLVLGSIMGIALTWLEKFFNSNSNRLALTISFVILTVAISMTEFNVGTVKISFSSLLVCMMLGTVFCNTCPLSADLMDRADKWTSPLFATFFVLSGAELELSIFKDPMVILVGVIYILARSAGKYYGAKISASFMRCDKSVRENLGITLLPQAGVALGMSAMATELGKEGTVIRNIILFGVLIYELAGPALTKMALTRAGDIVPVPQEVLERRQRKLDDLKRSN